MQLKLQLVVLVINSANLSPASIEKPTKQTNEQTNKKTEIH